MSFFYFFITQVFLASQALQENQNEIQHLTIINHIYPSKNHPEYYLEP